MLISFIQSLQAEASAEEAPNGAAAPAGDADFAGVFQAVQAEIEETVATDAATPSEADQSNVTDPIDLTIIGVYMVGIVALGCWAGLRRK